MGEEQELTPREGEIEKTTVIDRKRKEDRWRGEKEAAGGNGRTI